jgi:NAD-dependent SIR2 family protein deacetylase
MTIAEFRGSPEARRRCWARAHIGRRRIAAARPNAGHRAVAALQTAGVLRGIIIQNVDGLHQAGGAEASWNCTERSAVSCAWNAARAAPAGA